MFGPGCCIYPIYLKNVTPLVVFGPFAAKSWRRACHTPITYLLSTSPARVIWKIDSGVLFHTLYVTITNSQRQKNRMLIVIHFNLSRSFFYRDLLFAA